MTTLKVQYHYFRLVVLVLLGLVACTSPDEHIKTQFDTLPQPDSTLLYEYGAASSGATGDCGGVFLHRWYGTAMSKEDMTMFYADYLANSGWSIRSEDVVEVWSRESKEGLYRMVIDVFTDPQTISQEQGNYRLPATVLREAHQYQMVYLLSMIHAVPWVAKKCFEH
jgi:hypothetical protein